MDTYLFEIFWHGRTMLLIGCIWFANETHAQSRRTFKFESFTINDGLSQGFISSIVQDNRGLMWIATADGLNKYDGYSFTVYHHDPEDSNSLVSDDLTVVHEDVNGRLWIGTRQNGLDLFDRANNRFIHFKKSGPNSLRSDNIIGIAEDGSGALWIRTEEGVDRMEIPVTKDIHALSLNNVSFSHIETHGLFAGSKDDYGPEDIFIDRQNRIFITTNDRVMELDYSHSDKTYKLNERYRFDVIDSGFVATIIEDSINRCFFVNNKTIIRFPGFGIPETVSNYPGATTAWTVDKTGKLWYPDISGITILHTKTNQSHHILPTDPDHQKAIRAATVLYTDRSGMVWLGSGGYGLLRYDPELELFHHILRGSTIYQLIEDKSGYIVTNQLDALDIRSGQATVTRHYIDSQLVAAKFPKQTIVSFSKDMLDNFWIGIHGGIIRYDIRTKNVERIDLPFDELPAQPYPIYAEQGNHVWMGYKDNLVLYDQHSKNFTRYNYPSRSGLYGFDFIQSIFQDKHFLWLGSVKGLYCFNTNSREFISSPASKDSDWLQGNYIYSFCEDPFNGQRYLWIGTKGNGLNRLDKLTGEIQRYDTRKGLSNNVVYGVLSDDDGNLWMSTNKGISALQIATGKFRNFDVSDGLQSNEFNRNAFLKTRAGLLVFGGMNGLNYFNPKEIQPLEPPDVVLTGIRLFNKPLKVGDDTSPLTSDVSYLKNLVLQQRQNVLTLQFAATDYRKHGNIRYRYKMQRFDADWIYSGKIREATYTNLDPGDYTFIVQASFDNGNWTEGGATISIDILTPWWRAWWFYLLIALFTIIVVYALYRYRLNQLRRFHRLRDRIARDLHDEVGSSVSTIVIYSKIVHEQVNNPSVDKEPLLKKIADHATDIMESLADIVWSVNSRNDTFERIVSKMREHSVQLLEAKGYELYFKVDDQLSKMKLSMDKRRNFYLIYKEAINNIAKYAEGKHVWVTIQYKNGQVELSIRDDGKGFDRQLLRPNGNGLSNMKFRADALKGKLKVGSNPGVGTEITLHVPVS